MTFDIIGEVSEVEVIAVGRAIRELPRLRRVYGAGRWRKMKGKATICYVDGRTRSVELHWYEAHGIGRVDWKVKKKE